jgi:parallel beta-helix repeat protein
MADEKISALPEMVSLGGDDLFVSVDDPNGAPATKKINFYNVYQSMPSHGIDTRAPTVVVASDGSGDFLTIQAGINALPALGGLVFVKNGLYSITTALTIIKSNVTLQGQGEATEIKIANGANIDAIHIGDDANAYDRIKILDFKINGNKANQASAGIGIDIDKLVTNVTIARNHITETKSRAFNSDQDGVGLFISENIIDSCADYPVVNYANDCYFINNIYDNATLNGPAFYSSTNVFIYGNYIRATAGAVLGYSGLYTQSCTNVLIAQNVVLDHPFLNIWVNTTAGVTVTGNVCSNTGGTGIEVDSSSKVTISGNSIRDCQTGILVYSSPGASITGNVINAPTHDGINIQTAIDFVVSGNTILNPGSAANNTYSGILVVGTSLRNLIVNNTINSTTANKINYGVNEFSAACDYNFFSGNIVTGYQTAKYRRQGANTRVDDVTGLSGGPGITTLRTAGDQTINAGAATFVDITDLTFPVENGKDYAFKFYIVFQSANVNTGWKAGVNCPTGVLDFFATGQTIANGAAGVATWLQRHNTVRDDMTLLTSTITAAVDLVFIIEGRYKCTQTGTFAARFANELAANTDIVVQKGSWGFYF